MAVSERAQVPTVTERRAKALDDSRSNCTLTSVVLTIFGIAMLLGAPAMSASGDVDSGAGLVIRLVGFVCLAFGAVSGGAAMVLSGLRDAARTEG